MKLPLLYIPKLRIKFFLNIEKKYRYKPVIIPIGNDCHPAYMLGKLKLRNDSLPFDWLYTTPIFGIKYVLQNMNNNFKNFLSELCINKNGNVISAAYKHTQFIHEKDLINNLQSQKTFTHRIERLMTLLKSKKCYFIFNVPSMSFDSSSAVEEFIASAIEFTHLIKEEDRLLIYIRYDESNTENAEICDKLTSSFANLNKISIGTYIINIKKCGMWGKEKEYIKLLNNFGINLSLSIIPKIYLTKKNIKPSSE